MKIITFSDLNWSGHLRSITKEEVLNFKTSDLQKDRYERIARYYQITLEEDANLVLFAGDVTGDGFCGHGFHYAFIILLQLLEEKKIHSLFISGNHDPSEYYNQVKDWIKTFQYVKEISNKCEIVDGIKIQGLNYDCSKSKRALAKTLKNQEQAIDILLAHSQIKRRIRHFDFPCSYIFTGHYDRKLFAHRNKVFIALDNDYEEVSYAVLSKNENAKDSISIKIRHTKDHTFGFKEEVNELLQGIRNNMLEINGIPSYDLVKFENASDASLSRDGDHFLYLKYLRGINYANSLDTMYKMKQNIPLDMSDLSLNQIHGLPITASYQISERMIEDYLGNVID